MQACKIIIVLLICFLHSVLGQSQETLDVNYSSEEPYLEMTVDNLNENATYSLEIILKATHTIWFSQVFKLQDSPNRNSKKRIFISRDQFEQMMTRLKERKTDEILLQNPNTADVNHNLLLILKKDNKGIKVAKMYFGIAPDKSFEFKTDHLSAIAYTTLSKEEYLKAPIYFFLGGSEGGYAAPPYTQFLANKGGIVVSVAYFGVEGTPECLSGIEIQNLEKLIQKVTRFFNHENANITLIGASRGADYATYFTLSNPDIVKNLFLVAPQNYVFSGILCDKNSDGAAFISHGETIDFIPDQPINRFPEPLIRQVLGVFNKNIDMRMGKRITLFQTDPEIRNKAKIPYKNLKSNTIIISGTDDATSFFNCKDNSLVSNSKIRTFCLKHVGHDFIAPPLFPRPYLSQANDITVQKTLAAEKLFRLELRNSTANE